MLERTDAIKKEVLESITFVLAYPTVRPSRIYIYIYIYIYIDNYSSLLVIKFHPPPKYN